MKTRRYFATKDRTEALAPVVSLVIVVQELSRHCDWDEITFNEWWPIYWALTDYTDECPPCPEEQTFWDKQS